MPKKSILFYLFFSIILIQISCKKSTTPITPPPVTPPALKVSAVSINGVNNGFTYYAINDNPVIKISFSVPVDQNTTTNNIALKTNAGAAVSLITSYENDSTIVLKSSSALNFITEYLLTVGTGLKSKQGAALQSAVSATLITAIDSSDKFPRISDSALLTLIQQQTFKYFWDFGHPLSGLARESSNGSSETVTTGGSGFGIMAMIVAVDRGFISRSDAVTRLNTITNFLITKCERWHGAFSHWIDGSTGATIPFGNNNGADIVETSYLIQGLLTARQYFNNNNANEIALRDSINSIWNAVDWNWFTQNGNENGLYWQYNPGYDNANDIWSIPVSGWNEALITYVLAASSTNYPISKNVYDNGWAGNGAMKNGKQFFGITLPLGPDYGGPLFFSHYSFLGINPHDLSDAYANYWSQDTAHSKINYLYCVNNPKNFNGYSNLCWGLTASNEENGYSAHSPTNDDGVISPTAAISSLPYTPTESMNALNFFYYKLGDKIWGDYGFKDAFNLTNIWFDDSYLAIDQGPQIVMIENYRTGLLWNLFMSCLEIKRGMKNLGFQSPDL